MDQLLVALISSLVAASTIVLSNAFHGHFTNDSDLDSVQKFHDQPVPRIGGLAVYLALLIVWLVGQKQTAIRHYLGWILVAGLPIFAAGVLEDITKKISARSRLYISFLSAAMVYLFMNIHFLRIDLPFIDQHIITWSAISFILTLLVISSTVHALNLIDGFNGLMLGVSLLMFSSIAIVSYHVNDWEVLHLALICFGAIAGLFLLNFPFGKIFAGDSGAYFIGFLLSTIVLMLVARNPAVSAWFPCLLLIYPLFETLFSIYRKVILRNMAAMQPDGVHLHMLIYKRIARHITLANENINNAITSPYLWLLSLLGIIPATIYWNNTLMTIGFCLLFLFVYIKVYWQIVLFKDRVKYWRFSKLKDANNSLQ